jgi:hypothetical protein
MNKRHKADQDLFSANAALQRRSRILAREARIDLLERFLASAPPCWQHTKVWQHEIDQLRDEIAAEGPDQP